MTGSRMFSYRVCLPGVVLFLATSAVAQTLTPREAAQLDKEGKCGLSGPYYARELSSGTPSPALLNNAGNHYLICGQPVKAREYFKRLLAVDPSHPNANLQLARMALQEKKGAEALQHLDRVNSTGGGERMLRAEALYWAGKPEEARALLDGLAKEAAHDERVLFLLGLAYGRIGLYEPAEAVLQDAAAKQPGNFEILFHLGRAAARASHFERAREALEAALRIRPGDTEVLLELGRASAASKDYIRAVFLLAQARQKAPGRPDIALALARAAEDAGFYGDSALAYDDYVRLAPADDAARRDRSRVLALSGDRLAEGVEEMEAYVRRHPEDPVGHYNLAQFSWRTDPQRSLAQLQTALRLDGRFSPAHVSRAWLLHRLGRSEEAVPHLEAALAIDPGNVPALDLLGLVHLALDRPEDAEATLRRALALAPEDPDVLLHLGRALMAIGRDEEARHLIQKQQALRPRRARDPRRAPGMIELATLPESERRQREIGRFRRQAQSRPDDPLLQMHLANLLLQEGGVSEAAAEYERLLTLNADAVIWAQAGQALLEAGQYGLARRFLERAADSSHAARLDLAIAILHEKGAVPALLILDEVPVEARSSAFLLVKARILDAVGRRKEAERLLSESLARAAPMPGEAVSAAMLLLLSYGRSTEAVDLLSRASESAPDDADIKLAHAIALATQGQTSDAGELFGAIETRWPEWDRPYLAHGLLLEMNGKKTEALGKLRIADALGSADPAVECSIARLTGTPLDRRCRCPATLREWLFWSCSE